MATSSITKEFFVKDDTAFEKLKKELDTEPTLRKQVVESPSLKKRQRKISYLCISLNM